MNRQLSVCKVFHIVHFLFYLVINFYFEMTCEQVEAHPERNAYKARPSRSNRFHALSLSLSSSFLNIFFSSVHSGYSGRVLLLPPYAPPGSLGEPLCSSGLPLSIRETIIVRMPYTESRRATSLDPIGYRCERECQSAQVASDKWKKRNLKRTKRFIPTISRSVSIAVLCRHVQQR